MAIEFCGCEITREPVGIDLPTGETTGWEFTVRRNGYPVPVVVTALDRKLGLNQVRKAIRKYVAESAVEPVFPSVQS